MGKKNRKPRVSSISEETGMPRHLRREVLETVNSLLEYCSFPFGSRGNSEWDDFITVYDMVEKLRKKQQNYVIQRPNRDEHMSAFVEWLRTNNVDTEKVTIAKCDATGYGLVAKTALQELELFLSIDRKLMITTETAKTSVLGPVIERDRILQSMPNVVMALHLLCEMCNSSSFWQPYLNILPAEYDTPLYFKPDELQLLKNSPALSDFLNQYRNITRQYAYFFKLFQGNTDAAKLPIKNICFDDYRWAVSTVTTRQNQIPTESGDSLATALIPMWDMCNHCNGQISTDFNTDRNCGECYAMRQYEAGEQIFIFYGNRSNTELLLHNGFVYPENDCDRMTIKMGISKNDSLFSMKAEILARLQMPTSRIFYVHKSRTSPVDGELLSFLRVFCMGHEELMRHLMGEGCTDRVSQLPNIERLVSVINEKKAWAVLETRAHLLLGAYHGSAEDDESLLSSSASQLSHKARLAVQLRLSEKQILDAITIYARAMKDSAEDRFAAFTEKLLQEQSLTKDVPFPGEPENTVETNYDLKKENETNSRIESMSTELNVAMVSDDPDIKTEVSFELNQLNSMNSRVENNVVFNTGNELKDAVTPDHPTSNQTDSVSSSADIACVTDDKLKEECHGRCEGILSASAVHPASNQTDCAKSGVDTGVPCVTDDKLKDESRCLSEEISSSDVVESQSG